MKIHGFGKNLIVTLIATALIARAPALSADFVLNPTSYHSASGHYELFIDPSSPNGSGSAFYRMTRDGELVWSGERPFTLWAAKIASTGTVAGYAYEGGVSSPGHHGVGYSKLTVCILDHDGSILQRDSSKVETGEYQVNSWAGGNSPRVLGTLLDEEGDRFILRIPRGERSIPNTWWNYRLTTGEFIGTASPDLPNAEVADSEDGVLEIVVKAERVPETPFVVVHWVLIDFSGGPKEVTAMLSVLALDGKQLWKLELLEEYGNEEESRLWNHSPIVFDQLEVYAPGFAFSSLGSSSVRSFALEPDSGSDAGWRVVETDPRERSSAAIAGEPSHSAIETIELEELEPIRLQQPSGKGQPLARISDFVIDGDGCFGFVGLSSRSDARFIRVAPSGEVLADIAIDKAPFTNKGEQFVIPAREGRWIVVQNSTGENPKARGWWLDPHSGDIVEMKHFASPAIDSIVSTGDGGFVTLSSHDGTIFTTATVERFDRNGVSLWRRDSHGYDEGLDFDALTWLPDVGAVALSGSTSRSSLTFFSPDGETQETVEMADILNRKLNYPTGLRAGPDGGLLLYDFDGTPCSFGIDSNRHATSAWTPRLPDGRKIPIVGDVQTAPDGSLWTSDGQAFLRLDEGGVIDKSIRPISSRDEGGYERIWTVDSKGKLYTFNRLVAEIRVYASDGSFLHACKTDSADYDVRIEISGITVDGEGRTFVHMNAYASPEFEYLAFSAKGERIGWKELPVNSFAADWLMKTGTGGLWVLGHNEIFLLDENDQVVRTLSRRANRDWLQRVADGAVATDGSLAVITGPLGMGNQKPAVVSIYDADGESLQTLPLHEQNSFARIAYDGKRVVTADDAGVFLYKLDGVTPKKIVPKVADDKKHWFAPFLSPDGTELWLAGGQPGELLRYRL